MPEGKKPWEQDLQTEEKSSGGKPWEKEYEVDEPALKKKDVATPSPSESPLLNTASPLTGGASASSGKYNFATGENQLLPFAEKPPLQTPVNEADLLRAAPSTGETTPKDINQFSPEIQKTGLLLGDKTESFLRGTARLGNSILKTPAFAYDIASSLTNRVINKPLGITAAPSSEEIGKATGLNGVTSDLDKAIENSAKNFQEKYDKGVTDYFKNGEYGKGFNVLANAVAESAPTTISLMLGNAAGLSTAGSVGAGGLVVGADKMSQLEKENPDMTHEQKTTVALANGLMEGVFEQFGLTKLGAITKAVLTKSGEEAAKKIAEEGFKKTYGKILTRYLGTSAEEALSEAATQFSQNAIDKYSGVNPNLDLRSGVADAAIVGLGSGVTIGTPTSALEVARTKEAVKRASEIQEHKKVLEEQLQNPDVSEEVKAAISNRIKDLTAEDAKIAGEEKQKFEQLPEEKKMEVDDLLKKAHAISTSAVDETISTPAREIFKRDIDNIDEKITEIYDQAEKDREQAATEKGLVKGEKKSEPIDLSTEIEPTESDKVNEDWLKSFEESIKPRETPVETIIPKTENNAVQEQGTGEVLQRQQEKIGVTGSERERVESGKQGKKVTSEIPEQEKVKEKPVQELVDEQEQLEAKKEDDEASVKKLNDDIEVLKKFDKPDIASKKFSAILERAFKMKEEGKISKPTYTAYRNMAQQVLEPKVGKVESKIDAELAKYKIETLKEVVKKKLLGEGYKKVLMSARGFGPKQVADLIDLTAKASQKAIDLGFTVKQAVKAALSHIKTHPHHAKLIKEGYLDEKAFTKSVYDTFTEVETETEEPSKKEETTKKEAVKDESEERKLSGIKKALLSDEVINSVDVHEEDMKGMSRKEMHSLAKKFIDSGEVNPEEIVNEVLITHRALQPKEVIGLIYYKTELDNKQYNLSKEKTKLINEGESTGSVDAKLVDINQKIQNYNLQSAITSRQNSLAFSLRQALRDSEFNLVTEIERYKATNNGEISPEVEARMKELDKECREMSQKIKELEQEAEEREIDDAHRNIIEDIERQKSGEKKKTITQKGKELADKFRKLKGEPLVFTTRDGKEIPIQKQGLGLDAMIEVGARVIEKTAEIIDGVNAVIKQLKAQEWYKKLSKTDQEGVNEQVHDHFKKRFGEDEKPIAKAHIDNEGKLVIPHSLIRSIYETGITDINEIVKEVHKQIEMPEVTERQIRDAITRYGKTVNLNKDEVEAGIRQAKRIGKLLSQLEDIRKNERPKRSGLQRDKPSDEERRLLKEVKHEMKSLPEDPEEDARALRSALQATKTRLTNRLADLENQLKTGDKTPKSKGVELDQEAKDLQEKIAKVKAEIESKEGKPKMTDEQRLARMKTYAKNRLADLENKIKNKDFSKKATPKPISDTELTKARGELAEKRDKWEKLQYENELKNRNIFQTGFSFIRELGLGIWRTIKLGFDFSAALVQGNIRLFNSPKQSLKAFGDMFKQTYSEKYQKEWMKKLKGQEYYPILKSMGAEFTETDGKISVQEEHLMSNLIKGLFKFIFNEKLGFNTKFGRLSADKINLYEASNRAYSGYLNSIRLQGYLEGFRMLERQGMTPESHPHEYKSWVRAINNVTGRGHLGKKANSSALVQDIFTAPKKFVSEFNQINPVFFGTAIMKKGGYNILGKKILQDEGKDYNYSLTPTVARKFLSDQVLSVSVALTVSILARAAFSGDHDDDKDFWDPRSSNFLGIKIPDGHGGYTVVNLFGARKTLVVLLSRILPELWGNGKMTNSTTGKTAPLGKKGNPKGNELLIRFLENKLSPGAQVYWNRLKQGEKYDVKKESVKAIEPSILQGFLETYKDYPAETETFLTIAALFGAQENHIEKKKR